MNSPSDLLIVGVGASAGGLDAMERFTEALPLDRGLAVVLVMHLDPSRETHLCSLLSRRTSLPVEELTTTTSLEPNRIYVVGPGHEAIVRDDSLVLSSQGPHREQGPRHTIDRFFRSLASSRGDRAVAVILSGTGSDGMIGAREIRDAGGLVLAQDPRDARNGEMPRYGIDAGVVDVVSPAEDLPEGLLSRLAARRDLDGRVSLEGDGLWPILDLMGSRTGQDFRCYKPNTIQRRVERRMGLRHMSSPADYLELLRDDEGEVQALYQDLLIGVTSFFRDPEVWDLLRTRVLPEVIEGIGSGESLRVWTPACSTGEEAYTVAMLALRAMEASKKFCKLQVFATDLSTWALEKARLGVYPEGIAEDVPEDYLSEFFVRESQSYRVRPHLRDVVLFSKHNLLGDPPFSRLDLVTCRNFLIYVEAAIQDRLTELFHYALRGHGHLVLGSCESIGSAEHLFQALEPGLPIFRRQLAARSPRIEFPIQMSSRIQGKGLAAKPHVNPPEDLGALVRAALLAGHTPIAVLINRTPVVLYHHGATDRYLRNPPGESTMDLYELARDGLGGRLRGVVNRAIEEGAEAKFRMTNLDGPGSGFLEVCVSPLPRFLDSEELFLITFAEHPEEAPPPAQGAGEGPVDAARLRALERELLEARVQLSETIRDLEHANQELKQANQQVGSINEELQSSNEELETSKEELQSLNEELTTVNSELTEKLSHLEEVNDDLHNLINGTGVSAVFLDFELRIVFFTPSMTKLFRLIPTDIGRPLADLTPRFEGTSLAGDARHVLDTLETRLQVVRSEDGRWIRLRILPYRTKDHRISGVVITFEDIDDAERVKRAMKTSEESLVRLIEACPAPMMWLDPGDVVRSANEAASRWLGRPLGSLLGQPLGPLVGTETQGDPLLVRLEKMATGDRGAQVAEIRVSLQGPASTGETRVAAWSLIGIGSSEDLISGVIACWGDS